MKSGTGGSALDELWCEFQLGIAFLYALDPLEGDHVVWRYGATVSKQNFRLPLQGHGKNGSRYPDWVELVRLWKGFLQEQ